MRRGKDEGWFKTSTVGTQAPTEETRNDYFVDYEQTGSRQEVRTGTQAPAVK